MKPNRPRCILLSIPNTLSTRNLLRTNVLPLLKAEAEQVVIVAPFATDRGFREEFVTGNVVAYPMLPHRPGRFERILHGGISNLHLCAPTPDTLTVRAPFMLPSTLLPD